MREVHVDAVGPEKRIAQQARQVAAADLVQDAHREFVHGLSVEDERAERDRQAVDAVDVLRALGALDPRPRDPGGLELRLFGIVQIEAMALGKPVVSSDLPSGMTYVNRDGETGLTFRVGDDAGFAEACNRLLSDERLRDRLGEAARRRTFEKFSYSALGKAVVPFFERLCGEDGR